MIMIRNLSFGHGFKENDPKPHQDDGGLSAGTVAGIVIGLCAFIVLILVVLWKKGYVGGKDKENKELQALELPPGIFSLRQIEAATHNFDSANKIGEGNFGPVYKPKEEFVYLLDRAYGLQQQGNLIEMVDPRLGSNYSKEEAMRMLNIALLCTDPSPTIRPAMSAVVSMLEEKGRPIPARGISILSTTPVLPTVEANSGQSEFRANVQTGRIPDR
ncbi:hypothetical protein L1987_14726 [Smallanthus sonchifolius]|uniref:Uncharacterized protein n=1 Tax=Smallanthus sonchifolius TaxID=185202 RepID=A0ACB9J4N0_9ASTR|nr:hypothetical protein L1987_14726 [Smallanthus sonchifolius]